MKILLTGANGLLGSHVARVLLNRKYSVRAVVRKGSNLKALEGLNVELFRAAITDRQAMENAVIGCDFVIHVAAQTSQNTSDVDAFRAVNIDSTRFLMQACKKFRLKRFVFVSTANCFGNGSKESPGNEQSGFLPWLKNSGYAYSKYLAQQLVLQEVDKNDFDAVVINPTFIIGANDVKPSSGQIFAHVLNKKFVFYPPGGKNFVDAEMAAFGVVRAMEKGQKGQCYLLAGENHSYLDFFKKAQKINKQKTIFIPIPKWILMLAGNIGSLFEKVFKVPVQLTKTNARMLCLGNYFSSEKARNELDFKIVPTGQSIEKAILWFNQNNSFKSR